MREVPKKEVLLVLLCWGTHWRNVLITKFPIKSINIKALQECIFLYYFCIIFSISVCLFLWEILLLKQDDLLVGPFFVELDFSPSTGKSFCNIFSTSIENRSNQIFYCGSSITLKPCLCACVCIYIYGQTAQFLPPFTCMLPRPHPAIEDGQHFMWQVMSQYHAEQMECERRTDRKK